MSHAEEIRSVGCEATRHAAFPDFLFRFPMPEVDAQGGQTAEGRHEAVLRGRSPGNHWLTIFLHRAEQVWNRTARHNEVVPCSFSPSLPGFSSISAHRQRCQCGSGQRPRDIDSEQRPARPWGRHEVGRVGEMQRRLLFEWLIILRGGCFLQRADVATAVVLLWRWLLPLTPEHISTHRCPSARHRTVDEMIDRNNGAFCQRSRGVHCVPLQLAELRWPNV